MYYYAILDGLHIMAIVSILGDNFSLSRICIFVLLLLVCNWWIFYFTKQPNLGIEVHG